MDSSKKSMSFEEVCDLFDGTMQTKPMDSVILSNDEINRARRNKREAKKKVNLNYQWKTIIR